MSYQKEVRYTSHSLSPARRRSRSRSRERSRSRSRDFETSNNPGNNLYVTGLSPRVTSSDLEKYFNKQGKVVECHVVTDPRTRESRGFGFVTMDSLEDANRCVKYLNRSVLEGRLIKVEKAKRKRARTPTPGKYCGARESRENGLGSSLRSRRQSPSNSPYRSRRSRSRDRSPERERSRDHRRDSSTTHRRHHDRSPAARGNS